MRVYVAQINPKIGDLEGNTAKILECLDDAKGQSDIVLFPELTICGYPPGDFLLHAVFIDTMENCLQKIARASDKMLVLVGLVRRNLNGGEKPLLNSVAIIENGKIKGYYDKWLLPNYNVFDERRYFEPGKQAPLWQYKGKKIGIIICEDIWQHAGYTESVRYGRDPILELAAHHPDILLNLSASPYQYQKPDVRVRVCAKAAKTLQCPVILCCQVGGNDQIVFDGHSVHVDAQGRLLTLGKGFTEDCFVIDLEAKTEKEIVFDYNPIEDLYQALVLGTKDYFYKLGFKKAVIGLSGGIDSALVACIAKDALGQDNVLGVSMPSHITSHESKKDASELAANLGIELWEIPIDSAYQAYIKELKPFFAGKSESDITEENLQARIRGTILMAISNKLGHIVLATGNKSEMAMGFCTLYGDMVGGLAPISDVLKTTVYEIAYWINRNKELIPHATLTKPPSAELRPNQFDTDSLPDYKILDTVLKAYVEDYLSPEQIAKQYGYKFDEIMEIVRRIHGAEYKRQQSPPGIRVSKKAFRVGRRYPIVQGWL